MIIALDRALIVPGVIAGSILHSGAGQPRAAAVCFCAYYADALGVLPDPKGLRTDAGGGTMRDEWVWSLELPQARETLRL